MTIKNLIKSNQFISYLLYYIKDFFSPPDNKLAVAKVDDFWQKRIQDVLKSSDNEKIHRNENAGKIIGRVQVMHNGVEIRIGSYYGNESAIAGMHEMLKLSKGVHEPQEEFVFQEILKTMRNGALMVELGAYWSFYSLWFNKCVPEAKNYMIEPDARCLYSGKRNFKLNKAKGVFIQKKIDSFSDKHTICIDDFMLEHNITRINLLHSDIQGFELAMLQGANRAIHNKLVDYIFISTHSDELHSKCKEFLIERDYYLVAEADMLNTFSYDGLLVFAANKTPEILVSQKSKL